MVAGQEYPRKTAVPVHAETADEADDAVAAGTADTAEELAGEPAEEKGVVLCVVQVLAAQVA